MEHNNSDPGCLVVTSTPLILHMALGQMQFYYRKSGNAEVSSPTSNPSQTLLQAKLKQKCPPVLPHPNTSRKTRKCGSNFDVIDVVLQRWVPVVPCGGMGALTRRRASRIIASRDEMLAVAGRGTARAEDASVAAVKVLSRLVSEGVSLPLVAKVEAEAFCSWSERLMASSCWVIGSLSLAPEMVCSPLIAVEVDVEVEAFWLWSARAMLCWISASRQTNLDVSFLGVGFSKASFLSTSESTLLLLL